MLRLLGRFHWKDKKSSRAHGRHQAAALSMLCISAAMLSLQMRWENQPPPSRMSLTLTRCEGALGCSVCKWCSLSQSTMLTWSEAGTVRVLGQQSLASTRVPSKWAAPTAFIKIPAWLVAGKENIATLTHSIANQNSVLHMLYNPGDFFSF